MLWYASASTVTSAVFGIKWRVHTTIKFQLHIWSVRIICHFRARLFLAAYVVWETSHLCNQVKARIWIRCYMRPFVLSVFLHGKKRKGFYSYWEYSEQNTPAVTSNFEIWNSVQSLQEEEYFINEAEMSAYQLTLLFLRDSVTISIGHCLFRFSGYDEKEKKCDKSKYPNSTTSSHRVWEYTSPALFHRALVSWDHFWTGLKLR